VDCVYGTWKQVSVYLFQINNTAETTHIYVRNSVAGASIFVNQDHPVTRHK